MYNLNLLRVDAGVVGYCWKADDNSDWGCRIDCFEPSPHSRTEDSFNGGRMTSVLLR